MRSRAYPVDRTPSRFNPDEVVPEIVELLFDAGLSRLADGNDTIPIVIPKTVKILRILFLSSATREDRNKAE
jgi:hypothetical protein